MNFQGGHASYGDALNYTWSGSEYQSIKASYFMGYHSGGVDERIIIYNTKGQNLSLMNNKDFLSKLFLHRLFTYRQVCIKSVECQENIEMSRLVADNITARIRQVITENQLDLDPADVSVWTYAIYYPYYEQYITLADDAIIQVHLRQIWHKNTVDRTFVIYCQFLNQEFPENEHSPHISRQNPCSWTVFHPIFRLREAPFSIRLKNHSALC